MSEQVLTFHGMHADHRHWHSDNDMWQEDIGQWQRQYETALTNLKRMEEVITGHKKALSDHAEAIARQEKSCQDHERGMAAYTHEGAGAELQEAMVKNHRQQADRHKQQFEAHERLKQRHHAMMAHLAILRTALNELQ